MWTGGCREVGFWRAGDKRDLSINIIARLVHGLFWMLSSPKRRITKRVLGALISIDFPTLNKPKAKGKTGSLSPAYPLQRCKEGDLK